jgi:hypothetical protein
MASNKDSTMDEQSFSSTCISSQNDNNEIYRLVLGARRIEKQTLNKFSLQMDGEMFDNEVQVFFSALHYQ